MRNAAIEIIFQMGVESVGEDAVIARGLYFPSDDSNSYRQLAGQHAKPIKPAQQKPEPDVQDEKGSPNQLPTSDHTEDIAEEEKVGCQDRHQPP